MTELIHFSMIRTHGQVKVLADKVRAAADFIVYTGAGISTASGISDYASKGKQSGARAAAAKSAHKGGQGLDAHPTLSHFVLTALHRYDQDPPHPDQLGHRIRCAFLDISLPTPTIPPLPPSL